MGVWKGSRQTSMEQDWKNPEVRPAPFLLQLEVSPIAWWFAERRWQQAKGKKTVIFKYNDWHIHKCKDNTIQ